MPTTYAIPNGRTVMDSTLYTGTNAAANITNTTGFKPDLVWIKDRSNAYTHVLVNSVAGANKDLYSNQTSGEQTSTAGTGVTAFNSNGFALGTNIAGTSYGATNINNDTFVAWQWQAGQGSNTTNTTGTITSTVSANTAAGFSIVTYTGTGSAATVGHGLGAVPQLMIVKNRSNAYSWSVYSSALGNTQYLFLNGTSGAASDSGQWNNTTPTSSVFTVGNSNNTNVSGNNYVAYCWAQVAGFSQFGVYTGNGSSSGPFIYCGFQPQWVMIKQTSSGAESWYMHDTARSPYNNSTNILIANLDNSESTNTYPLAMLSNGFQIPTSWSGINGSGTNYLYIAFASNPFKYANAR